MASPKEISEILLRLERLEAFVGIPEDDFVPPKKALEMMGYGAGLGETKLRELLKRALYANDARIKSCPLKIGIHFNAIPNGEKYTWLVNWPKMKQQLARGPSMWAEVPEIPPDYGAYHSAP
ncbi:MAG: hypothetical protein AAGJ95_10415 [Cyanobacteria bacterium J06554_11]